MSSQESTVQNPVPERAPKPLPALEEQLIGKSIGRYRILMRLGRGGMGLVYEAEDALLNRRVAVKFLPPNMQGDVRLRERFFREAQVTARLSHPNIIAIHDIGEVQGRIFVVMELLSPRSLGSHIREGGALHFSEATRIIADCCSALAVAHAAGLVHRDVKPDNILCSLAGVAKVTDFGLVKVLTQSSSEGGLTMENAIVGSPSYMSPEQIKAETVDARSDIYSLGMTYYAALAGRPPFSGATPLVLFADHCGTPTPDPREVRPDIPAACVKVLLRATAKSKQDRYQSAAEMKKALEDALAQAEAPPPYAFLIPSEQPWHTPEPQAPEAAGGEPEPPTQTWPSDTPAGDMTGALESPRGRARSLLVLLATMVICGAILFVANRSLLQSSQSAPMPAAEIKPPIKVGVLHSMSGPMSITARPITDATLLAIDEINERGGLLGRPIEPVVLDGKTDADSFAQAAERLIVHDKVAVVFGGWHSSARRGIKRVVEQNNHLLIYPGSDEGLEDSAQILYLGSVPSQQVLPALRYFSQTLGKQRVFVIGNEPSFARPLGAIIADAGQELGMRLVGERIVREGATEFERVVRKIAHTGPDLIVNALRGDANISFFRALMTELPANKRPVTLSLALDANVMEGLASLDLRGSFVAASYFETVERPQNREFLSRLTARFGGHRVASDAMAAAYEGVHLWAQGVRATGSFSPIRLRQALKDQTLEGPAGVLRLDPSNGHAWRPYRLGRVSHTNRIEIVESSPQPLQPILFPRTRTRTQWEALLTRTDSAAEP
ncbi:MAG: bifunctional serine/threonine-protein kinase/ABC transporter substrate-binding protein [Polyangia bacterium]